MINITNEDGYKDGPVSLLSHKNWDWGISGDFWGDGADSAKKVDTLAGRRVSSTLGKRLAEARRASHSVSLGEVMTQPYTCIIYTHAFTHITYIHSYPQASQLHETVPSSVPSCPTTSHVPLHGRL